MVNLRLNRGQLEMLILKICSIDGQAKGTSPPHGASPMGKILTVLLNQLKALD